MAAAASWDGADDDGTVDKWLTNFNNMFKEFGTVKDPLPPASYYESKLFASA
ncbi:hypothetical protein [Rhizobium sullae]|uniref:hypothetical protein n=1 Tax=Rhizobium sullae TaxID=50338 RepID=UPI0015C60BCE|nr:hypothetical protein [Rhizobium sullae]